MSELRNNATIYGVIGIIISLIGIVALIEGWISIETETWITHNESIDGINILDLELDDFQKYIPIIIAILSLINAFIFAIGIKNHNNKKLISISTILGVVIIIFAIIAYLWISGLSDLPGWESDYYWSSIEQISPGVGLYLVICSGVFALVANLFLYTDKYK